MKSKTLSPKSSSVSKKLGSYGKKMKDGGSLGMKSVKAGFDNNPGVTRADIITAAKGKAKNGKPVKKAFLGAALPIAMKALPMLGGMLGGKGKGGGLGGMLGGLLGGKNGKTIKKSRSGSSIKKAQGGATLPKPNPNEGDFLIGETGPMKKTKTKERSESGDYVKKTVTRTRKGATTTSSKVRRTLQGFMNQAPKVSEFKTGGKMKSGGAMKKCKYGCK